MKIFNSQPFWAKFVEVVLGIVVAVIAGIIVAYIIRDARFDPNRNAVAQHDNSMVPTPQTTVVLTNTEEPLPIKTEAFILYPRDGDLVEHRVYVRGNIQDLWPGQRAFLIVKSVQYDQLYPQGEILPDPLGNWLLNSVYQDAGYQYETFVVVTNNPVSADMLANRHFREVGISTLPDDTEIVSNSVIVQPR